MATSKLQNRNGDVGRGDSVRNSGGVGDDAKYLLYGMLFFAIVSFICLPIAAIILIEAKKTNVVAQSALIEAKKMRNELKPVKKEENDE